MMRSALNIIPNVFQNLANRLARRLPRIDDRKSINIRQYWSIYDRSIPKALAQPVYQILKHVRYSCLLSVFTASTSAGFAQQAILESSSGDNYAIEIQAESTFREVVDSINESLTATETQAAGYLGLADVDKSRWNASKGFSMRIADNSIVIKPSSASLNSETQRDYHVLPTAEQKADMNYIANSLANFSLIKLKTSEAALKKAGDRIEYVHPLQFLAYLFTNEETKVSVRNLEGRAWVWKEFLAGFIKSLGEESKAGLVLPYAQDFANRLGIDVNLILPTLQSGNWEQFIVTLIRVVPRKGDSGRYDM